MQKLRYYFFLAFFFLVAIAVWSSGKNYSIQSYKQWSKEPETELFLQAQKFESLGKEDSALVLYNIVAGRYDSSLDSLSRSQCILSMIKSGNIYRQVYYNFSNAYRVFNRAIKISREDNYYIGEIEALIHLALLYANEEEMEKTPDTMRESILLLRDAFKLSVEHKYENGIITSLYNMVVFAYGSNQMGSISDELNLFYTFDYIHDKHRYCQVKYTAQGLQAISEKDYDKARKCFEYLKPDNDEQNREIASLGYQANMAEVNYREGNIAEAIKLISHLKDVAVENNNKILIVQAYKELAMYYSVLGDEEKYNKMRLHYYELKNEITGAQYSRQIGNLQFMAQLDSLDHQIITLSEKHKRSVTIISALVILIVVVIAFLAALSNAYRRLRSSHERLYRQSKEIMKHEVEEQKAKLHVMQLLTDSTGDSKLEQMKYRSNIISEDRSEEILLKIQNAMLTTDMICSSDFSIKQLATAIGEKQRDVSQVINDRCGCNFHTMLAEYRIKEACRLINETTLFDNQTIEALALAIGIKSRSYFATSFKNYTGLNPSEYIRIAKEKR